MCGNVKKERRVLGFGFWFRIKVLVCAPEDFGCSEG